jgi:hypothetical protein
VVAQVDPALFREIGALVRERYPQDKASYHVSADPNCVPALTTLPDDRLPTLLDERNARQVFHVTFGSVMAQFGPQLMGVLQAHEEAHYAALARHLYRHLEPFV